MAQQSLRLSEGFVKLAIFCNRFNFSGSSKRYCIPFVVDGRQVGLIRPDVAGYLRDFPEVFLMEPNGVTGEVEKVELSQSLTTFTDRSNKVAEVLQKLREKDAFMALEGWRDECYDVKARFAEPALLKMERSATCLFGVVQYGVHINGYTYQRGEGLSIWLGKRSATKPTFPGLLDQMAAGGLASGLTVVQLLVAWLVALQSRSVCSLCQAAGGLASGLTVMQCAWKECQEEASVPDELLKKLKPGGCISYFYEDERGLFPECQFVMDLEVPEDFTPVNADGETESFQLVSVAELKQLIIGGGFKFNCALCALDFLMRHSQILPDEEPNYNYLSELAHASLAWK
ncbi:Nudix hydrolase 20, chloroplastic [Lamellibrachia satsuma]|nr:Nudix hydrolase 20, chloroplastic [Lamellibrachia satsuma]